MGRLPKINEPDILKVSGILSLGYGLFPKLMAKEKRVSIESKAIYAYFCSYAGSGNIAFPKVDTICSDLMIGEDRYRKHFRPLVKFGYITVEQERTATGLFMRNVYTLNTEIQAVFQPSPQNKGTVKNEVQPSPQNRGTENKGTNINSSGSNTSLTDDPSFIQKTREGKTEFVESRIDDFFKLPKHGQDDIGVSVLVEQVEIEYLQLDTIYPGLKDAVVSCLDEMYRCNHISVKGVQVPQQAVRARLAKLSPDGLKHAVMAYLEACRTRTVMNPARYLMSAIYEAQGMVTLRDAADFQRLECFAE